MKSNQTQKHFTFLELLVVIAVITILITLLIPSLRKAKFRTVSAVCLSSQGQLYRGLMLIGKDRDNHLPYANFAYSSNRPYEFPGLFGYCPMIQYGLSYDSFNCPINEFETSFRPSDEWAKSQKARDAWNKFKGEEDEGASDNVGWRNSWIGYSYWAKSSDNGHLAGSTLVSAPTLFNQDSSSRLLSDTVKTMGGNLVVNVETIKLFGADRNLPYTLHTLGGTVPDFNQFFGDGHGEIVKFKTQSLKSYSYEGYTYWVK